VDSVLLSCEGAVDGPLTIPPFELRRGEAMCLQEPFDAHGSEERLYPLLTGKRTTQGLRLHGKVILAMNALLMHTSFPVANRLFGKFWASPRVDAWLRRQGMTQQQAAAVMQRLDILPHWRMNRLPGNPKMQLGLAAAFSQRPDVVVVSVSGVDPVGQEAALAAVSDYINRYQCGAIYVCHPYWHQWRLHLDFIPGLPCYPLQWAQKHGVLATSDQN
jgi:hypothetical protein